MTFEFFRSNLKLSKICLILTNSTRLSAISNNYVVDSKTLPPKARQPEPWRHCACPRFLHQNPSDLLHIGRRKADTCCREENSSPHVGGFFPRRQYFPLSSSKKGLEEALERYRWLLFFTQKNKSTSKSWRGQLYKIHARAVVFQTKKSSKFVENKKHLLFYTSLRIRVKVCCSES